MADDFFRDKVFLISGAGSGIGRSLALAILDRGGKVAALGRRSARIRELEKTAGKNRVLAITCDVTRQAQCVKAVKDTLKKFERLDGIIHNAGVSMRALAENADVKVYEQLFAVNFFPLIYFYRAGIQELRRHGGVFAGVSSLMGKYATQVRSGYSASKHAVHGYLDSIRIENLDKGVHVLAIIPGYVNTEISFTALTADGSAHNKQDTGLASGLSPDTVAERALKAMEKKKREVIIAGWREKTGYRLSRLAPNLLDKILLKSKVT